LLVACSSSPSSSPDAGSPDAQVAVDWAIAVDPAVAAGPVSPALLGHYDLSGSLFDYRSNQALQDRMRAVGFAEWRVGLGRWEIMTRLLPTLADGQATSCAPLLAGFPAAALAPANATDATLIADRDWFSDTGQPVALADTASDARYRLDYVRGVIDTALAFGAEPFVDIDHMPRALSANRTFFRGGTVAGLASPCFGTWSNRVSNARPADPAVFAAAVVGLVRRVVEGSGGQPGRPVRYWELWNEPELGYAWEPSLEQPPGTLNAFFAAMLTTLVQLDAYRAGATAPAARALELGIGSFAYASTAASFLSSIDTNPLPGGQHVPLDFVSFHAYSNDPLAIIDELDKVARARAATTHYRDTELVLAEWGPNLGTPPSPTTMDIPLVVATVLARAPAFGITRAHHSLFFEFFPDVPFALLDQDANPMPLYHAYALLHAAIGGGATRLVVAGAPTGALADGDGAVLVVRGADGIVRALVVNRGATARSVALELAGARVTPTRVRVFDDPAVGPREISPTSEVTLPARSIALVEGG
jgi:hypothetical protein